jgi:hypothetical protein
MPVPPVASPPARPRRALATAWATIASLSLCTAAATLWLACGGASHQTLLPHGGTEPPELREACARADLRCSTCHALDRVVAYQHRGRASWEQQVRRMRLKPGSGITVADADLIVQCLIHIDTLRPTASLAPLAPPELLEIREPHNISAAR